MTLKTDIDQLIADAAKLHDIIHGASNATVATDGGNVPTVAKAIADMVTYWQGLGVTLQQNPAAVAITGGSINGTAIGNLNPAAGAFTTLSATQGTNLATASGHVGIGTTSPNISAGAAGTTALTVSATASAKNAIVELKGTRTVADQVSSYIRSFSNAGATPGVDLQFLRGAADTDGYLLVCTSGSERARVTDAGVAVTGTLGSTGIYTNTNSTNDTSTKTHLTLARGTGGGATASFSTVGDAANGVASVTLDKVLNVGATGVNGRINFKRTTDGANAGYVGLSDTNVIDIGADGGATPTVNLKTDGVARLIATSTTIKFPSIGTTASAANAYIDNAASNSLLRSTSSLRYKTDLIDMTLDEARAIALGRRGFSYKSTSEADDPDQRWIGYGAEEIEPIDARFATHDEDGKPAWVQYERFVVPHGLVLDDHEHRLTALEARPN